jgi:hypothetical protein
LHSLIFVKISIFLKIFPKIPHFHKNLARLGLVPMPLIGIFSPAIFDVSASGGVILVVGYWFSPAVHGRGKFSPAIYCGVIVFTPIPFIGVLGGYCHSRVSGNPFRLAVGGTATNLAPRPLSRRSPDKFGTKTDARGCLFGGISFFK